jgi:signal transduction histidine kinase
MGYLIFDYIESEESTIRKDIQLLSQLKPHIVSGFVKTKLLGDLEQANEELKKLNDKKNEFLGIAAHDLRNPLNAIIGFIDLLIMDYHDHLLDTPDTLENMQLVQKSAKQMAHLITELLDISAIESGKISLDKHRYNLNILFEECERMHKRVAVQKNIRLSVEDNIELPDMMIDKMRIMEVIDNLISNALKYTHPGGIVRVYAEVQNSHVVTHIQDTGQGLDDEDLKSIFITYKKLSARPTGGESSTGLGLAIVKKIVELHDGKVWVESIKGKGSTFSFSLPVSHEQ